MTNKKRKVRKLNKKIIEKIISIELIKLQDENAALYTTKNKLEDPNYVTTFARGEYMFSKGDEKVFYLPSNNNDEASQ